MGVVAHVGGVIFRYNISPCEFVVLVALLVEVAYQQMWIAYALRYVFRILHTPFVLIERSDIYMWSKKQANTRL